MRYQVACGTVRELLAQIIEVGRGPTSAMCRSMARPRLFTAQLGRVKAFHVVFQYHHRRLFARPYHARKLLIV